MIDIVLALPDLKEKYSLRGITRDPSSGKSKALAKKGVEMVAANVDDAEALKAAVRGSYGVFGVTDFWSIMDKARETQQGKNIFEACKAEKVKHFVFSSLPSADKMSGGKYKVSDLLGNPPVLPALIISSRWLSILIRKQTSTSTLTPIRAT